MKVTTHYIAFWSLLIIAEGTDSAYIRGFSLVVSLISLIFHHTEQRGDK